MGTVMFIFRAKRAIFFLGTVMVMGMVKVIFRAKRAKILRYSCGYRYGYGYILNQNEGTVLGYGNDFNQNGHLVSTKRWPPQRCLLLL